VCGGRKEEKMRGGGRQAEEKGRGKRRGGRRG